MQDERESIIAEGAIVLNAIVGLALLLATAAVTARLGTRRTPCDRRPPTA